MTVAPELCTYYSAFSSFSCLGFASTHALESLSNLPRYRRKRLRLCQENGLVSGKPTEKVARCLEQHFLRSDSLTTEHVDTDTDLNERLRGLLGSVLQRCLAKELAAGPNRIQDFERVLGKAKVQQIADVCDEIEKAKLNQCNTCSGGACSARPRSRDGQLSLAGEIPMAVRNLYFGTKLPTLWDSQDGVDSLAPAEWDQHYEVAVKHLEAYRAFVGAQSSA